MKTIISLIGAAAGFLSPIIGVVGTGLSSLVSYLVNKYIQRKQQQANANRAMQQDMESHSGDGAISVGDKQSAEAQMQDLKNKLAQIDSQKSIQPQQDSTKK